MKIDITPTPEMIVNLIDEYCSHHLCPRDCVFDKIGLCTENDGFNEYLDRYEDYMKSKRGANEQN